MRRLPRLFQNKRRYQRNDSSDRSYKGSEEDTGPEVCRSHLSNRLPDDRNREAKDSYRNARHRQRYSAEWFHVRFPMAINSNAFQRIAYMISRIAICFRLSARARLFQYVFTKCPVALSLIQPVILRALHAHADRMPFARNYVCAELWISYKACQVG